MGAGVARQCSENRCLARWTVWIPHRGRRGGAGRANSKKDLVTGPIRGFCALQAKSSPTDLALEGCELVAKDRQLDVPVQIIGAGDHLD